jgi:hypothetical protein
MMKITIILIILAQCVNLFHIIIDCSLNMRRLCSVASHSVNVVCSEHHKQFIFFYLCKVC